ncbi:MAG: Stp1/IreP family PP2C-type Ser/Thr phosphatase [Nitrosomonas sp.]|nr:MAG: Stp1/IreP family PP2C-type Ser/Thr phosphatase [Nitrosomonas sp.]
MVSKLMSFQVLACGLSDVGLVRRRNEDAWVVIAEHHLYFLADGMGGHRAGDVAAREAVASLTHLLTKPDALPSGSHSLYDACSSIRLAFEQVNRTVYTKGKTEESLKGMGTTLCCLHIHEEGVIYAHVGDSRIYRLRGGELEQLSEDHSLLRELVASGQISDENARLFAYKNIITKAIGTEPIVEPSVSAVEMQEGDLYLMCSDGLSDLVSREDIETILLANPVKEDAAKALVAAAIAYGGQDNITVVIIQIQATDETSNLSR